MLTKNQKAERIEKGIKEVAASSLLFFADFTGVSAQGLRSLKKILREAGAEFKVIKKRLLRIIFEKSGVDFNPEQFETQAGTIFSSKEITETAGPLWGFAKDNAKGGFKILGAYDLLAKKFIDAETVVKIGKLPPREVLLGQIVGMLAAPIKMFMNVLNEKSKTVDN